MGLVIRIPEKGRKIYNLQRTIGLKIVLLAIKSKDFSLGYILLDCLEEKIYTF
jgi:hypothetical protein